MKKFITVLSVLFISVAMFAQNSTYSKGEIGLNVGTLLVSDVTGYYPEEIMLVGVDFVYKGFYLGSQLSFEYGPTSIQSGYAFRLKTFNTTRDFNIVVAPYIGLNGVIGEEFGFHWGVYTNYKVGNRSGIILNLNTYSLSVGYSYAF